MSLPIRIRDEAQEELNAAWNWYEQRRDGLGDELLACVEATLAKVARAPEAYPRVDGLVRSAVVRRFPYLVLFREYTEYVVVLAVFHTSRDPSGRVGRDS